MDDQQLEQIIKKTIALLPEEYSSKLTTLQVIIEKQPLMHTSPHLVGRYHATPETEKFAVFELPNKITIYKMPLLRVSQTLDEARGKVKDLVLHELAYYFDISDEQLYLLQNKSI
jgi:predicted Zn-dependent protease with MMP-like domain